MYLQFICFRFLKKQLLIGTISFGMCVLNISSDIQLSLVDPEWRWRLMNPNSGSRNIIGVDGRKGTGYLVELRGLAGNLSLLKYHKGMQPP